VIVRRVFPEHPELPRRYVLMIGEGFVYGDGLMPGSVDVGRQQETE
jgi:hypothetical protein